MATTDAKPFTLEQLAGLPNDGRRFEIIRGELVETPPTGFEHSGIAGSIVTHLNNFVWRNQLGRVASEGAGFVLSRAPDVLLAPDASFVSNACLADVHDRAGFLSLTPDLVVEVISSNDTVSEVAEKVSIYLQAGVRLV